ncbi:unnamed protein product [Vitrella brassicaformis CCMP3155]|uniref:Uncharacterized protein n=1 Tax=Vitrella brassicaformis (strain CCMP3155) TaxID=1169540 RepID=A0A0G4GWI0_VITBC|nr:unnamed protein product [Vitrella brassicaformis CCMP3155]|eukprot:CEM35100.1 unnamed protein product [Vitrella brassicaformis CCMP3155]
MERNVSLFVEARRQSALSSSLIAISAPPADRPLALPKSPSDRTLPSGSRGTVQLSKDLEDVPAKILSPQNHGGGWDELTTIEDPAARVSAATWLV